jgi:hypothetical protein
VSVFIAHAKRDKALARQVAEKLRARDLRVFLDEDTLPPGEDYDGRIRAAILSSDVFVFLASEASTTAGAYALTELGIARRKWPNPAGRVLPVAVGALDLGALHPYLTQGVTVLQPSGDLAVETADAVVELVSRRTGGRRRLFFGLGAVVVATLALVAAVSRRMAGESIGPEPTAPSAIAPPTEPCDRREVFERTVDDKGQMRVSYRVTQKNCKDPLPVRMVVEADGRKYSVLPHSSTAEFVEFLVPPTIPPGAINEVHLAFPDKDGQLFEDKGRFEACDLCQLQLEAGLRANQDWDRAVGGGCAAIQWDTKGNTLKYDCSAAAVGSRRTSASVGIPGRCASCELTKILQPEAPRAPTPGGPPAQGQITPQTIAAGKREVASLQARSLTELDDKEVYALLMACQRAYPFEPAERAACTGPPNNEMQVRARRGRSDGGAPTAP